MTVPFRLRDGSVVKVQPRDYSFYEEKDDSVWCTLCKCTIPKPSNPVNAISIDNETSKMSHSIRRHLGRRQ